MKNLTDVLEKLKVDDIVFDKNLEDIIKKYLEDIYGKPLKVANVMFDKTPIVTAMYEMTKKEKAYYDPSRENRKATIHNVVSLELQQLERKLFKEFEIFSKDGTRQDSICFVLKNDFIHPFLEISIGWTPDTIVVKNYTEVYDLHFK